MAREAIPSRPAPSLIDKHGGAIDDRKVERHGERSGRAAMTLSRGNGARGEPRDGTQGEPRSGTQGGTTSGKQQDMARRGRDDGTR